MNANPYESPEPSPPIPTPPRRKPSRIGTVLLGLGLATLTYGVIAFWIIPSLPPNNFSTGRLNSLYVLSAGIVISLIGLAIRDLRMGSKAKVDSTRVGISTGVGCLLMLAAVIIFIVGFAILR